MAAFYETNWFKYLKNLLIGLGAAFIIIGALFKIMHWPYANEILTFAMIGEALIFAIQAIIPPHKDYYWEKMFPGLDNISAKMQPMSAAGFSTMGAGTTQQLDTALAKAGVNKDLIGRLGTHLNSLGDNLSRLSSVTSTTGATSEFSKQAKEAAQALSQVKVAYRNAANVAKDLEAASDSNKKYQQQVAAATGNLAKLNAVYELELKDANNHIKALNKFHNNMSVAMNNISDSVEDTKRYKVQMAQLSKNLSSLNNVYGNMLSAMSMGAGKR